MRKIETYPLNSIGASCFFCHNSRRRLDRGMHEELLDTERFIDRQGKVVICSMCVYEAASIFGCLTPETSAAMSATIEGYREELAAADIRIKELETLNDAFTVIAAIKETATPEVKTPKATKK